MLHHLAASSAVCSRARHRARRLAVALLGAVALAGCGGGGGGGGAGAEAPAPGIAAAPPVAPQSPPTRAEAMRFLTQATFGPTEAEIQRVMSLGYERWIDEQLALAPSSHRARWEAADAASRAAGGRGAGQDQVLHGFWATAVTAPDQLRQRVAFAWSQVFVISTAEGDVERQPRAAAAWLDMLGSQGLGRYRELLEGVTRHPLMGSYLSHLRNQRADPRTGRVPDENFAREVMQLFSIGLHQLHGDGTPRLVDGRPQEAYDDDDITGLARVFTGWSWDCPDWPSDGCFRQGGSGGASDPDRWLKPMVGYPQFHSPEEKRFLGAVVPAQTRPDPEASLRVALDTLAAHPNVGPFIGRQLIQRLVTSNPSPGYVAAVARAFDDNGAGVRGDLRAVVKAVLLHPEARRFDPQDPRAGKVREPVLRLSALLRAFDYGSDTGQWRLGATDNPANALAQTPLRAPSVFNFWRPGYVAPGTASAAAGLVAPELQALHETSAAGYVNLMRDAVSQGLGAWNGTVGGVALNRRDIQGRFDALVTLADQPPALVDAVVARLTYGTLGPARRDEIAQAVGSIAVPVPNATGSNANQIANARRNRVQAAVLLVLVTPEFIVQR